MRLELDIETHDRSLGFALVGVDGKLTVGTPVPVPGGASLVYRGTLVRKTVGIPEILKLVIDTSLNIELSLFAAWLYDKCKASSVTKITIQRREITDITEDRIRHVLEETLRIED